MGKRTSLWILEKIHQFNTRIDCYIDVDGNESWMKWIPPFRACRALTSTAAVATPSGTIGDWFHPEQIQSGWVENVDYEIESMGGFWVDMFLCSSPLASSVSAGAICNGTDTNKKAYISQPGVCPICSLNDSSLTISHFRQYLKSRFNYGGFAGAPAGTAWAGKGGLITDAHWFELWTWARINRWLLRGNTNGYNASNHIPQWHLDPNDIGILDPVLPASYGASLTGGGSSLWEIPISDFCGNRWEFTDGLRLYDGKIYSAGKKVNPFSSPSDGYGHADFTNTNLLISGVTTGQSIASYRTEQALKRHGIAASTTTVGQGGFDGQGWWHNSSGEVISLRGGACVDVAQCPGALLLDNAPSSCNWPIGARAVLVP